MPLTSSMEIGGDTCTDPALVYSYDHGLALGDYGAAGRGGEAGSCRPTPTRAGSAPLEGVGRPGVRAERGGVDAGPSAAEVGSRWGSEAQDAKMDGTT